MDNTQTDLVRRANEWLKLVSYKNYRFTVKEGHGGVHLFGEYDEEDVITGELQMQTTRKWLLSPYMTKSEFIQTVFKCALTSEEHKAREHFLYTGVRVFSPHYDIDSLAVLASTGADAGGRPI